MTNVVLLLLQSSSFELLLVPSFEPLLEVRRIALHASVTIAGSCRRSGIIIIIIIFVIIVILFLHIIIIPIAATTVSTRLRMWT